MTMTPVTTTNIASILTQDKLTIMYGMSGMSMRDAATAFSPDVIITSEMITSENDIDVRHCHIFH